MKPLSKFATIAVLGAVIGLGAPSQANAQGKSESKSNLRVPAKAKAKAKPATTQLPKAKNYDFLADDIDGSRVLPDNTTVFGIQNLKHTSLIRLREHFINEIVRSADML